MNFRFSQKQDEEGFNKAMADGDIWRVVDIWFAENTDGDMYWEIEMDTWYPDKDPIWEVLAHGHGEGKGHDKFEQIVREKQADEHFCSIYPDGSLNMDVHESFDKLA